MPTIKDVAEKAGVSVTTVSRVMNNRGAISDKMRARVREAMESLDYQPNEMARSLQLKRTHIIGMVVLRVDQPFYSRLIQAVENVCAENDYKLLLCTSEGNLKKETMISSMLRANKVDGVIVAGWVEDSSAFAQQDMPVVTIERMIDSSVPMVACDNFYGGQLAARTLSESGSRNIAYFGERADITTPVSSRILGFEQECDLLGVARHRIAISDLTAQGIGGRDYDEMVRYLYRTFPEMDSLFVPADEMAANIYFSCVKQGIKVPEELQILGFDGLDVSRRFNITTISQPIEEMGSFAIELLLKRIEHKTVPNRSVLPVELIRRGTTK